MSARPERGRFITFEGGEGSGKSTQVRLLAERLKSAGATVVTTREPGGSPMGERIRGLLLDPDANLDAVTQALLFSAARRDHVVRLIAPALDAGAIVLCDRFADSTRAYQQAAGSVPAAFVETITKAAVGAATPDLTIILDISPDAGLARASQRRGGTAKADAFEASDLAFHRRVRDGYLAIAASEPGRCVVIDAEKAPEVVAREVAGAVFQRLGIGGMASTDG